MAAGSRELADQFPNPDADREQIQDRLDESRDERDPHAAVGHRVAFDDASGEQCRGHSASRFLNSARANTEVTAMTATRNATWPNTAAADCACPVVAARHNSIEWYSGET